MMQTERRDTRGTSRSACGRCGAALVLPAAAARRRRRRRRRRSPRTSRRSSRRSARRATGPTRSRRCRSMTYAEARPWARSIKARVADRQMPPWQIDRTVGIQKFKNDRSLTDDQVDTIVRWVDAGAPQGDPKDMPAAEAVARRSGLELRGGVRPERAGPDHQVVRLHDAGGVAGRRGTSASRRRASPSRAGCARSRSGPRR